AVDLPAPPPKPEFRFDSPTKQRVSSVGSKSYSKSSLRKKKMGRLGDHGRRSNSEEFHANFTKQEDLYMSYTRFLHSIRFDVKEFTQSLRKLLLPTDTILKVHDKMSDREWELFLTVMADEEYWKQVKGVGSAEIPK